MSTPQPNLLKTISTEAPRVDDTEGTILLPISKGSLILPSQSLLLDGMEFSQKPELHITLVGRKIGQTLVAAGSGKGLVFGAIRELAAQMAWSILRSGRFVQLHKEKPVEGSSKTINARSIVELVDLPGASDFFKELSQIAGSEITPPPFHITIYTNTDPEGIGVSSEADLILYREKDIRSLR